jgi:excisionase family DNA binding protein
VKLPIGVGVGPYLTTEEAAKYICAKRQTLETWRCRGVGPAYFKQGSKVLYAKEDLDRYVHAGGVRSQVPGVSNQLAVEV